MIQIRIQAKYQNQNGMTSIECSLHLERAETGLGLIEHFIINLLDSQKDCDRLRYDCTNFIGIIYYYYYYRYSINYDY